MKKSIIFIILSLSAILIFSACNTDEKVAVKSFEENRGEAQADDTPSDEIDKSTSAETKAPFSTQNSTQKSNSEEKFDGIEINKKDVTETAIFIPYTADSVKMEVFAVKASDGNIRTAFNTCQVCYDSGRGYYVQQGNVFVCQNCGNRFRTDDIEKIKGGCNPVPITGDQKTEDDTSIKIPANILNSAKELFSDWKK